MPRQYKRTVRPIIFVIGSSIAYVELTQGLFSLIDIEDAPTSRPVQLVC